MVGLCWKLETSDAEGDKHMEDVCFTVLCLLNVRFTTYTGGGGMVSSRGWVSQHKIGGLIVLLPVSVSSWHSVTLVLCACSLEFSLYCLSFYYTFGLIEEYICLSYTVSGNLFLLWTMHSSLSVSMQIRILQFLNPVTLWYIPKTTARNIVVHHPSETVEKTEFDCNGIATRYCMIETKRFGTHVCLLFLNGRLVIKSWNQGPKRSHSRKVDVVMSYLLNFWDEFVFCHFPS